MRIRNSPIGFAIAAGVLVFSLYCFPDRDDSSRLEEQTRQTTQPIQRVYSTTTKHAIREGDFMSSDYGGYLEEVGESLTKTVKESQLYKSQPATRPYE
ncbi:MAG: hypothetical protein ABH840_00915 [Nanoarchaeota archaeon]